MKRFTELFFLEKDHPFRLSTNEVSKLTDKERRDIMFRLQDDWGWKGFYIGLGATSIVYVIYIRLQVGYFPLDVESIVGYSILTPMISLIGGLVTAGIGTIFSICGGLWNGLIAPKDFQNLGVSSNLTYCENTKSQNTTSFAPCYSIPYERTIAYDRHQNFLASRPWRGY